MSPESRDPININLMLTTRNLVNPIWAELFLCLDVGHANTSRIGAITPVCGSTSKALRINQQVPADPPPMPT